jgi:hypothetical protein
MPIWPSQRFVTNLSQNEKNRNVAKQKEWRFQDAESVSRIKKKPDAEYGKGKRSGSSGTDRHVAEERRIR